MSAKLKNRFQKISIIADANMKYFHSQLSNLPHMTDEDSLDDLSDIVGSELAGLANNSVMQPIKTTQSSYTSDMPADISDLRYKKD